MQFDHIGIVAATLEQGRSTLESTLPIAGWTAEFADPVNGVYVQFCRDACGIVYEVVAPLGERSPVAGALASRHNVLNHVAYLVSDLGAVRQRIRQSGIVPVAPPKPAVAYDGRPIQFFVTPLRFIIELIEAPDHQHQFAPRFEPARAAATDPTGALATL